MGRIDARAFFARSALEQPCDLYARMRELAPVCAIGDTGAYLVSTHAAIEDAVARQDEFSANLRRVLLSTGAEPPRLIPMQLEEGGLDVIATADDPAHSVHRRLMMPSLKASRIAALEEEMRAFARERVDALRRAGGGDFCAALGEPLPAWVVLRMLDLGDDALEAIRRWAMMGGDILAGRLDSARMSFLMHEAAEQFRYLAAHLDELRARPAAQRGQSLSATLAEGVDQERVSREEAIGILSILFSAAGESTAGLLGSATRLLASDPALQQRLRDEPSLIPRFVEEANRLETPFKFHYRSVQRRTQLCGTELVEGDVLLLCWAAANRDPQRWDAPDALRLDRARPERHLGFGHGIHYCVGAPLARLEVKVALEELLAGTRELRLDETTPPAHVPSIMVRRLAQLHLLVR
ncbi:MAG: cytochrome P450 [Halioglobus sp.]|nr:cytochrome P450 [Halioglobus sp.]MAT92723.1 cytochrome P450 [Halioglobus sp.]